MKKHIAIVAIALIAIGLIMWGGNGGSGSDGAGQPSTVAVRIGWAQPTELSSRLRTPGTTESLMDVEITAERSGKVAEVHFDANQRVEADDLLVELASSEETAAVREATVTLAEDERVLRHYETLVSKRAISETELAQQAYKVAASEARLAAAEAALAKMRIRAPFGGVLGFRLISPGTLVQPGDLVTTLDAIETLKVEFSAPEIWLGRIHPGDTLTAKSVAYPDKVFEARVHSVGTRVDPDTRTLVFKARVDNSDLLLKPGMFLEVLLQGPTREALTVPEESLLQEGSTKFVYRITDGDTVERREVETGVRQNARVEILSGLAAGDRLVREGVQKVRPGARVEILDERQG